MTVVLKILVVLKTLVVDFLATTDPTFHASIADLFKAIGASFVAFVTSHLSGLGLTNSILTAIVTGALKLLSSFLLPAKALPPA